MRVVEADKDDGAVGGGVVDGLPKELRHRDVRLLALGQVNLQSNSYVMSAVSGYPKRVNVYMTSKQTIVLTEQGRGAL